MYTLQHLGLLWIVGTMCSVADSNVPYVLAIINYYFHAPGLPVGYNAANPAVTSSAWVNGLKTSGLSYSAPSNTDPAVEYRTLLAAAPANSVNIVETGFMDNIEELLKSSADGISSLNGVQLVTAKVHALYVMGGVYISGYSTGNPNNAEYNFYNSPAAANYVCANWPSAVPVYFTGYEVGVFGGLVTPNLGPGTSSTNPIKFIYNGSGYLSSGRQVWDSSAAVSSGIGYATTSTLYFTVTQGTNSVNASTGANTFTIGVGGQYFVEPVCGTSVYDALITTWLIAPYTSQYPTSLGISGVGLVMDKPRPWQDLIHPSLIRSINSLSPISR